MAPNCLQLDIAKTTAKIFRPWDEEKPAPEDEQKKIRFTDPAEDCSRVPPIGMESGWPYSYWDWAAASMAVEFAGQDVAAGSTPAAAKGKQRPKKFRCPHCDVAFSNNGQLKGHVRIHTGERPYKCVAEGCGKSFTRNEELTRHKRIHSGLRPYPCPDCGKSFGRKDHLKKHARTHLPQPPQLVPYHMIYPYLYGY